MPTKEEKISDWKALVRKATRRKLQGQATRDDEAILWAGQTLKELEALMKKFSKGPGK